MSTGDINELQIPHVPCDPPALPEIDISIPPPPCKPPKRPDVIDTIEELEVAIYCAANLLRTPVTLAQIGGWKREWDHVIAKVRASDIPSAQKDRWSEPEPPDAIERLEAWKTGHKSRFVEMRISDGYGAACWEVQLHSNQGKAIGLEVAFFEGDPATYVAIAPNPDDDWPGLAATIHAAIDKAEKLGL